MRQAAVKAEDGETSIEEAEDLAASVVAEVVVDLAALVVAVLAVVVPAVVGKITFDKIYPPLKNSDNKSKELHQLI